VTDSLLPRSASSSPVSLPQKDDAKRAHHRAYELSLARTRYNYTTSYLHPAPLAAQVPDDERFTLAYKAKVAPVLLEIASNLKTVLVARFKAQLESDLPPMPMPWMVALRAALDEAEKQFSGLHGLDVPKDIEAIRKIFEALHDGPPELSEAYKKLAEIPQLVEGLEKALTQSLADMTDVGVTSFLRDTLYDVLRTPERGDAYLHAKDIAEFATLYPEYAGPPAVTTFEAEPWMDLAPGQAVWESEWYLGWLQIAGFNTSNLKGVFPTGTAPELGVDLGGLLAKMPATDAMLAAATGETWGTLADAAQAGRLYAVDLVTLDGVPSSRLHQDQRYFTAPVALFYWNPSPGKGYPKGRGSLQPVAIQLGQRHDPKACPVFTPGGDAAAWKLAKFYFLNALAIQHETVAHLGACHLTVETFVVATNRQLSAMHPILNLLTPHFRFTLDINESAKHSLIIPHGVVASVLSPTIAGALGMVRDARLAWRFDQNLPHRLFALRGVDRDRLPEFPFRDDTLLLWDAIRAYVRAYLSCWYAGDDDVRADAEVQAWAGEMTDPACAAFKGFGGIAGEGAAARIESFDYLVDLVSLLVYTAGPQHANVNYAQYPLMSYVPSVSGSTYTPPPTSAAPAAGAALAALPPVDVALYQISFGYLLSSIQYDTFGAYTDNPRRPYFADARAEAANTDFRLALATIEAEIRTRNKTRPLPYENQLPSMIPNSISI
jgi:arachidonate 15-lipoxygenase